MSFMSYAQVKVFARKGRNWIQTILYIYHFIEKGMFLQYVFKQSALCLIACFISPQQRSANTAEQQVHLVQYTVFVAPKEKNQGALNEALSIPTTEWGLTA